MLVGRSHVCCPARAARAGVAASALLLRLTLIELALTCCSFAGCELLGGIGWLLASDGWRLQHLDLSSTSVDDSDVELIGER